jgi:hypothetical protein
MDVTDLSIFYSSVISINNLIIPNHDNPERRPPPPFAPCIRTAPALDAALRLAAARGAGRAAGNGRPR